jgi:arabinofuranosyltransferase
MNFGDLWRNGRPVFETQPGLSGLLRSDDALFAIVTLAVFAGYALAFIDFSGAPSEDAAMLMRYARHLAAGAGIVWNLDQPPIDGATDFLFLVVIAGVVGAGVRLETAVLVVGLVSHVATMMVVYWMLCRHYRIHACISALFALWLGIGPGARYVSVYFGTAFFAMLAAIASAFFLRALRKPDQFNAIGFAGSSLLLGLGRPEGVFLSIFMLAGLVLWHGWQESKRLIVSFAAAVGVIGSLYFAWRWNYFGHPLPNPFYKKGGGRLFVDSLRKSAQYTFLFLIPVWPVLAVGMFHRETVRRTAIVLLPILGFTAIWLLLSNEMNWLGRFQYAAMPLGLMAWPEALPSRLYKDIAANATDSRLRLAIWSFGISSALMLLAIQHQHFQSRPIYVDGRFAVGTSLGQFQERNYVLGTSEAGLLPLYSGWKSIDLWGLNDGWIAQNGIVTDEYLDRYRPHVLQIHYNSTPVAPTRFDIAWSEMVEMLKGYAARRHYVLAAAWGETPLDTHCYFVRDDFPDSNRLIELIRSVEYIWDASGRRAIDFARIGADLCH